MKKILFSTLLVFLFLLAMPVYAEQQTLGVFKRHSCVNLLQNCANCTYVNFTSVLYPNSTIALGNVASTKVGSVFNYTFCNTDAIGTYIVNGLGDLESKDTVFAYTFEVNEYGRSIENKDDIYAVMFMGVFLIGIIILFIALGYHFFKAADWTFFLSFGFLYLAMLIPLFLIRMVSTLLINENILNLLDILYMVYLIFYGFMVLMLVIYFMFLLFKYLDWKKKPGWMRRQPI